MIVLFVIIYVCILLEPLITQP
eukprot:SAG25_NODE_1711_length_2496_cov_1.630371_3_plen_21_part_01